MTVTFAELTTMRVGGPVAELAVATSAAHAVDLVRAADAANRPVLVIGGGSNLVVGDVGWEGRVVRIGSAGVDIDGELVRADAGVDWDNLVAATVADGLAGLEALSGIPGSVGGTPVQNVGAYGAQTSDVLDSVVVYDRQTGEVETWSPDRCGFVYRNSVFKHTDRWVILEVTYRLRRSGQSGPIRFGGLARHLGIADGGTAPVADVRAAVLEVRRGKGMVLDADDHDTWSVGSFFLNPVLPELPPAIPADCPRFADPAGTKVPAAWLIEQAGFAPGYGRDFGTGAVALSTKHTLAVTNRGGATTADVMKFAAHIREGVETRFGVRLSPECHLINCSF